MSGEISNVSEWMQAAMKFGQQRNEPDNWPQIKMGTDQHKAWIMYFRDAGLPMPVTLRDIHMNKSQTWTAPCEWPADLPFKIAGAT